MSKPLKPLGLTLSSNVMSDNVLLTTIQDYTMQDTYVQALSPAVYDLLISRIVSRQKEYVVGGELDVDKLLEVIRETAQSQR